MLCKHISVKFQDIFTTPKESPLPKSMLTPHSPPICSLSLSIYLLCIFCISAIMPFPHNLMQLITSSSFKHFLHEASRITTLPGFPYPDLWTLEVQGPVLYLSLSLSLLSPWLTHHGFKSHPDADDPKLVSPARTLRRTPDSHILLSTWHLCTWPVILVQIKTEPVTFPTQPALPDSCQVLLRSPLAENLTAFLPDTSLSFLKKCILFICLGCAGSLTLRLGFL